MLKILSMFWIHFFKKVFVFKVRLFQLLLTSCYGDDAFFWPLRNCLRLLSFFLEIIFNPLATIPYGKQNLGNNYQQLYFFNFFKSCHKAISRSQRSVDFPLFSLRSITATTTSWVASLTTVLDIWKTWRTSLPSSEVPRLGDYFKRYNQKNYHVFMAQNQCFFLLQKLHSRFSLILLQAIRMITQNTFLFVE